MKPRTGSPKTRRGYDAWTEKQDPPRAGRAGRAGRGPDAPSLHAPPPGRAPSTAGARPRLPEPREPPLQKRLSNLFACTAITDILNPSPTGIFFPVVFTIVSPAALHCKDLTISPYGAFPVDAVKVAHSFSPPFKLSADTRKLLVPNARKNSR